MLHLSSSANHAASRLHRQTLFAAAALSALAHFVRADATWIGPATGFWSNPANWTSNPSLPDGIDQTATFNAASATITVDGSAHTIGHLLFASDNPYTLAPSGSGFSFLLSTSSGNATITSSAPSANTFNNVSANINVLSPTIITNNNGLPNVGASNALTFSGFFNGSQPVTFNGAGPVVLSGSNANWVSPITVNGTLIANNNSALGSNTTGTTVNAGGALYITYGRGLSNSNVTLNGGTLGLYPLNPATSASIRNLALTADSTFSSIATSTAAALLIGGNISGSANLTVTTGGFTSLVANSLSGNVTITGGTLSINSTSTVNGSFLSVPRFNVSGGALNVERAPGNSTSANSITPNTVLLSGNGILGLNNNLDPAPFINPNSTGGAIGIDIFTYTNAGSNSLNLNNIPSGSTLRIGTNVVGSIAANVSLIPDSTTHTLRFGIPGPGSLLDILPPIADVAGTPTSVDIGPGNPTQLHANTYTGLTTVNGLLAIADANALGSQSGTDADATIVNTGGTVLQNANLTIPNEKFILNGGQLILTTNGPVQYTAPSQMTGTYNGPVTGNTTMTLFGNTTLAGNVSFSGDALLLANATVTSTKLSLGNLSNFGILHLKQGSGPTVAHSLTLAGIPTSGAASSTSRTIPSSSSPPPPAKPPTPPLSRTSFSTEKPTPPASSPPSLSPPTRPSPSSTTASSPPPSPPSTASPSTTTPSSSPPNSSATPTPTTKSTSPTSPPSSTTSAPSPPPGPPATSTTHPPSTSPTSPSS